MLLPPYSDKRPTNHISPTPAIKPTSKRIYGKENGQPELPSQVQVQRTMTTSHIYPPQVFYDPMFSNPLYNPYHQFPYPRSHSYNQPPSFQDPRSPHGYGSSFQGNFKPTNASFHSSPSHQGYDSDPSNDIGNDSRPSSGQGGKMPTQSKTGNSSGPGISYGASNSKISYMTSSDVASRASSERRASRGAQSIYHGL